MAIPGLASLLRSVGIQASFISPLSNVTAARNALLQQNNIDLVIDVGANVGQYSREIIRNGYKGRILSFEPLSDAHRILTESSQKYPRWEVFERCCLGDREDTVVIHKSVNSLASSILKVSGTHRDYFPDAKEEATETAPMYQLDKVAPRYLKAGSPAFLKIDVQGFEEQVLKGAKETLPKLVGLQLELSIISMYDGQKLISEMLTKIEEQGFVLNLLSPAARLESGRWLQADCIFFRK